MIKATKKAYFKNLVFELTEEQWDHLQLDKRKFREIVRHSKIKDRSQLKSNLIR